MERRAGALYDSGVHPPTVVLETPRLVLRRFTLDDTPFVFAHACNDRYAASVFASTSGFGTGVGVGCGGATGNGRPVSAV